VLGHMQGKSGRN